MKENKGIPIGIPIAAVWLWLLLSAPLHAFQAAHELTVTLVPDNAALSGSDRIRLTDLPADRVVMALNPRIRIRSLEVDGTPRAFHRTGDGISVPVSDAERRTTVDMRIRYEGRFDDDVPVLPINTDNPGYGVSGTVGLRGTLLLGGAGWYPAVADAAERLSLQVIAPEGISAVTAGRPAGISHADGKTVSRWEIAPPAERLSLSAGRYAVTTARAGTVSTATYFLSEDPRLAATYLEATARYIDLYEERFGPYAFAKFAVVENFFPTGYGFPSYTLIGGRVLRLPFIVETSLGHEIAHCWWGNGVRVDASEGNWSEGLTTYVAEHLYQESASAEAARQYRGQLLRNYATLVPPGEGFPLRQFTHRYDPLSKVIGYDKCAMVFHMLRQTVGDDAFAEGLRRLYAARLHRETRWSDLREAFEIASGNNLGPFFSQWLDRAGAPVLWLEEVATTPLGPDRHRVQGVLRQAEPFYRLTVPLVLASGGQQTVRPVTITGPAAPFTITVTGQPVRLQGDPHNHVFRRLAPEEIPPAVNALKREAPLLVIVPGGTISPGQRRAAETLAVGLGREHLDFIPEKNFDPDRAAARDLLIVGRPRHPALMRALRATMSLAPDGFHLNGTFYDADRAAFFGVWRHPRSDRHVMAVIAHGSEDAYGSIARKISHYGRYSYLVFEGDTNVAKGLWETETSPLVFTWPVSVDD